MATKVKKKAPDILDQPAAQNDFTKLVEQVKANPVLYGAGVAFVVVCLLIGVFYRSGRAAGTRQEMTALARAVGNEDAALRTSELEPLAKGKGGLTAEAVYMLGESAYESQQYDKAKEAFERVRSEFPDSSYVPDAVEGLGYIEENAGQFDQAIATYSEIVEKWPDTFTARRQQFNIGRCQESKKDLAAAVKAYQAQVEAFPGSTFEKEANQALDRLRASNPDLFPKTEEKAEAKPAEATPLLETTGGAAKEAALAAPAAETPAPAPEAAKEAAPETPAPTSETPAPAPETPAPAPAQQ